MESATCKIQSNWNWLCCISQRSCFHRKCLCPKHAKQQLRLLLLRSVVHQCFPFFRLDLMGHARIQSVEQLRLEKNPEKTLRHDSGPSYSLHWTIQHQTPWWWFLSLTEEATQFVATKMLWILLFLQIVLVQSEGKMVFSLILAEWWLFEPLPLRCLFWKIGTKTRSGFLRWANTCSTWRSVCISGICLDLGWAMQGLSSAVNSSLSLERTGYFGGLVLFLRFVRL